MLKDRNEESRRRKPRIRNKTEFDHRAFNIDEDQLFRLNLVRRHACYNYLYSFLNSQIVQLFINVCVIVNIIILCMETYKTLHDAHRLSFFIIDKISLFVFFVEFVLKLALYKFDYFKNASELIDFLTLLTGLIECIFTITSQSFKSSSASIHISTTTMAATTTTITLANGTATTTSTRIFQNQISANVMKSFRFVRVIRLMHGLRALRVLKTLKLLNSLQIIIKTFVNSFNSIGAILVLMTLIMYMFAIVGCGLFNSIDKKNFGNVFASIYTCFRLIALDDWYMNYYKKARIENRNKDFEITLLLVYLLIYILIENFIMLNLFLAVIVDNFQLTMNDFESKQNLNKIITDEGLDSSQVSFDSQKTFNELNKNTSCSDSTSQVEDDDYNNRNNPNSNDNNLGNLDEDELNEIYGICNPFSKTIDPTLSYEQKKLLERHFQLLATIEFYMHENENVYQALEFLVDETVEEYSKY